VVCGDIDIHAFCVKRLGLRSARCGVTVKMVFFSMSRNILPVFDIIGSTVPYRYLLTIYRVYYILIYPYTQLIVPLCIWLVGTHATLCTYTCERYLVLCKY
jgi:hypothetical protein